MVLAGYHEYDKHKDKERQRVEEISKEMSIIKNPNRLELSCLSPSHDGHRRLVEIRPSQEGCEKVYLTKYNQNGDWSSSFIGYFPPDENR